MKPTPELVAIEILGKCEHCGGPLPVNRPVEALECSSCQRTSHLGREFWAPPLADARRVATSYGFDVLQTGRNDSVTHFVEWRCHRARFVCPTCQAAATLSEEGTRLECRSCGWHRAVEPTPAWMREHDGDVVGFVSDAPREDAPREKKVMAAVKCVNCGAAMTVDGSRRTVDCEYCSTANILPDAIWSVFHPPRVKQRWWLASLLRDDPRRALPELPEKVARERYADGAMTWVLITVFVLGLAGIAIPILVGTFLKQATGAGTFAVVMMMISSILFLAFLGGLRARWRGRQRWQRSRAEREGLIHRYNLGLDCYLPENEVVARITRVDAESGKVEVELFSPSEPETVLGTTAIALEADDRERLGGPGALLRGWFVRESGYCRVGPTPSVLAQMGPSGLEARDTRHLPRLETEEAHAPGYAAYLVALLLLGTVLVMSSLAIFT